MYNMFTCSECFKQNIWYFSIKVGGKYFCRFSRCGLDYFFGSEEEKLAVPILDKYV